MGALLVLLVLFSSSADQKEKVAAAEAQSEAARQQENELELAREDLAWRLEQLGGVRSRTADALSRARLQLAGIEEHARSLVDEFEQLGRMADSLEDPSSYKADADEPTIEDLEAKLAEARGMIDASRDEATDRPPAYAVVPYEGQAGTHRRPLYIECCIDGVFLQPEGIRMGPKDF